MIWGMAYYTLMIAGMAYYTVMIAGMAHCELTGIGIPYFSGY